MRNSLPLAPSVFQRNLTALSGWNNNSFEALAVLRNEIDGTDDIL